MLCLPNSNNISTNLQWREGMSLAQVENETMRQAVVFCEGNVTKAARLLAIGRSTLYRRLMVAWGPFKTRKDLMSRLSLNGPTVPVSGSGATGG